MELIIVITIFSILSGVVIFRFQDFQSNVNLQNLAQDVALQIAQARNDGAGGRIEPRFFNDQPSYGVSFNISSQGSNKEFTYFFDSGDDQKNYIYDDLISISPCGENNTECIDVISITSGDVLESLCVIETTGGKCTDVDDVNIVFTRPDLFAFIKSTDLVQSDSFLEARVTLLSKADQRRTISISRNGFVGIK